MQNSNFQDLYFSCENLSCLKYVVFFTITNKNIQQSFSQKKYRSNTIITVKNISRHQSNPRGKIKNISIPQNIQIKYQRSIIEYALIDRIEKPHPVIKHQTENYIPNGKPIVNSGCICWITLLRFSDDFHDLDETNETHSHANYPHFYYIVRKKAQKDGRAYVVRILHILYFYVSFAPLLCIEM